MHLGDLIDRGPDGLRCLRSALEWTHSGTESIVLPGNHEQLLLTFLIAFSRQYPDQFQRDALNLWQQNGGYAVCDELGLDDCGDPETVGCALRDAMVPELFQKLGQNPAAVRSGSYLFVHAGIPCKPNSAGREFLNPDDIPKMDWCSEDVLSCTFCGENSPLWVRAPFLNQTAPWPGEVVVVHGHTPSRNGPQIMQNRIGIDTGAFMTGRLTMLEIYQNRMWFHEAS